MTPDELDDALVMVSELVQNVTQHTAGGGELVAVVEPGAITIMVSDRSSILQTVLPPDAQRSAAEAWYRSQA